MDLAEKLQKKLPAGWSAKLQIVPEGSSQGWLVVDYMGWTQLACYIYAGVTVEDVLDVLRELQMIQRCDL